MCTPWCEAERFLAETQQIASKVAHEIWEKPELAMIQKVSRHKRLKKNAGVLKKGCVFYLFFQHVFSFGLPLVLEAGVEPSLSCQPRVETPALQQLFFSGVQGCAHCTSQCVLHGWWPCTLWELLQEEMGSSQCSSDIPKWFRIRNKYFDVLCN